MAKRYLMTQLWRIQQSYTLLSLVLWGVVIALTANPIILPFLQHNLGVDPSVPGVVAATLIIVFVGVFGLLFAFGVIYDKYLKLWREQLDVAVEKNPYTKEKLSVKEILMWRHMFLPTLRAAEGRNPETVRELEFMERWIRKSIAVDGNIRRALEEAERWVTTDTK